jgi:hypothetical protein
MNEKEIIEKAEQFLRNLEISFVRPGKVNPRTEENIEVVFLVPEALDVTVAVVDPPDVRVNINLKSGEAYLVQQM